MFVMPYMVNYKGDFGWTFGVHFDKFVRLYKSDHIYHITFARLNCLISFVVAYLLNQDCQIIFVLQTLSDHFHQITVVRIHLSDYVGQIRFVKICLYDNYKITYKDYIFQIRLFGFQFQFWFVIQDLTDQDSYI